ncbi:MAG: GIY-YIG nuclease family protein [Bacteroidota bacterium]|nr:GIY-YIG nuclease family protein [Bacteroidota bacterium]
MKKGYVYILSNFQRTTFYIGVTSNLDARIAEHRNGMASVFTKKYKLIYLVYFEEFQSIQLAISREKQLKRWHRDWKINLIKSVNLEMKDLMER